MSAANSNPGWMSGLAEGRHLANLRLIARHANNGVCECCRPGHGCAALERALAEERNNTTAGAVPGPQARQADRPG